MKMPDANVLVFGQVLRAVSLQKFQSTEGDGVQLLLAHGEGFAKVKIPQTLLGQVTIPEAGATVTIVGRPYAFAAERGMGDQGYSFVRYATPADIDQAGAPMFAAASGK